MNPNLDRVQVFLCPRSGTMNRYIVGGKVVTFLTMSGIRRLILDFEGDKGGEPDLITVITAREGAWRLFSDGSEHGSRPSFVRVEKALWAPESPTVDDLPKKS